MIEQELLEQALKDAHAAMGAMKAGGSTYIRLAAMRGRRPIGGVFLSSEMAFELFAHLEKLLQARLDVLRP
jgi:hypothetical protein